LVYETESFQLCPITTQYKTRSAPEWKSGTGKGGRRGSLTWLQLSASTSSALPSSIVFSWLQFPGKKSKKEKKKSEKHEADIEIENSTN
jgi:hypothetical protein